MNYEIIRSKRKTLAIEVRKDGTVIVRAPKRCSEKIISSFVSKNSGWIERTQKKFEERRKNTSAHEIADKDIQLYKEKAREYLPERVRYWSEITSLVPTYVHITSAQKRFGSCNGKNGICFSYRIMAYPQKAVDYVILHELAHITHKNHSRDFYALIEKYMPDYRAAEKILKGEI